MDESTPPDHSDISSEGDSAMLKRVGIKFVALFLIIVFFEELLELIEEAFELIWEVIHILIELVEQLLEEILEHLLHTDHHQTETIIANGVLIIVICSFFLLYKYIPRLYKRAKRNILAAWLKYKRQKYFSWQALSKTQKLKLASAYCLGFSLILLWLTL